MCVRLAPARLCLIAMLAAMLFAGSPRPASAAEIHWRTNNFTAVVHDKPLRDFLQEFGASQGLSVVVAPEVSGTTVNGKFDTTPRGMLDLLSTSFGLTWYYDGSVLYISPGGDMQSEVEPLGDISANQLEQALVRLGVWDPRFPISFDRVHNTARVAGPKRYVQLVRQAVEALNNGSSAPEVNLRTEIRVFPLRYAWAADFTYTADGEKHSLPGVVTVLRNLYPSARTGLIMGVTGRQSKLERLRGMGYFRDDQVPTPESDRLTPVTPRSEAQDLQEVEQPSQRPGMDLPQFQADGRLNAVIVRDQPERMPFYEALIKTLDVKPALVEIEARIIEVSDDSIDTLGVDWRARSGSASASLSPGYFPNSSSTSTTTSTGTNTGALGIPSLATSGLSQPLIIPGSQLPTGGVVSTVLGDSGRFLMARVSALSDKGKAHVVSSPRVLTLDNVEAVLENMSTFYVPVSGNLDTSLYNVSSGTSLRVTPLLINEDGHTQIKLAIRLEDGGITQQTVSNIPVIQRTTLTTQAFINEGESLLIGGYKSDVHNDTKVGIPGLSAIPGLGALFRHQQKESSHVEHLFMLTPRVVSH